MCSGRSNNDLIQKSKYANASPIVISSNGTLIFDYEKNEKIYESKIDLDILENMWNFAIENNIELTFNSLYKRFKTANSKKNAIIISSISEIDEDITQVVAETDSYKLIELFMQYINKFNVLECRNPIQHFDEQNNSYFELDMYNNSNDKGNAIKILLEYLNIDKNYAICFGDGRNDFSMFDACGYKVAMSNGNEQLKEKADFITEYSNDENGVAKFLIYHLGQSLLKKSKKEPSPN